MITTAAPAMSRVSVGMPVAGSGAGVGEAVGVAIGVWVGARVGVGATVWVGTAAAESTPMAVVALEPQ